MFVPAVVSTQSRTASYGSVQLREKISVQPRREAGGVQIRAEGIVADSMPQQQRVEAASYKRATKKKPHALQRDA
jgi:hypothetical protein